MVDQSEEVFGTDTLEGVDLLERLEGVKEEEGRTLSWRVKEG